MARKVFHWIHLWLSVPLGLITTLICFSGAMLVFEDEITSLLHRDICRVQTPVSAPDGGGVSTVPLGTLAGSVSATLDEGVNVTGVTVYDDPGKAWEVNISRPRRASVCVDQYTGEIKGRSERPAFFAFMFRLHRWLLDSMKPGETVFWGRTVVGVSTIAFVIVLISGLSIWWKNSLKVMKNRLKISVSKGWRPFWYSLHIAGGAYACIFLLAMALTGLTWSFGWYRTGFYKLFGAGTSVSRAAAHGDRSGSVRHGGSSGSTGHRGPAGKAGEGVSTASWQAVYMELAGRNPGYSSITVSDGTATVSSGSLGNRRASDRYTFDRVTGEITGSSLYRDSDRNSRIRGWIYSVHVGSWGGIVTRILAFLAALVGASLPLTGYYMWIRRLLRRRPA